MAPSSFSFNVMTTQVIAVTRASASGWLEASRSISLPSHPTRDPRGHTGLEDR